jgi:hypothetical protein
MAEECVRADREQGCDEMGARRETVMANGEHSSV